MRRLLLITGVIALFSACAIDQLAINAISDALGGEGSADVFTSENDPELVGDALPFALKLYDILLSQAPDNVGLTLAAGSGYVTYANAFLQSPADIMPPERYDERRRMTLRAKNLYLRGRDYVIGAIDLRHEGFAEAVENNNIEAHLSEMTAEDVPYLYWAAAGWMGAFSIDAFDFELGLTVAMARDMLERALELDEAFFNGGIHDVLISFYASVPEGLGGSVEKAEYHFERAVQISDGLAAGPYVSYATSVLIPQQDVDEFIRLMEAALAIDPDAVPESRLVNILAQRRARWYLDNLENFFFLEPEEAQ